MRIFARFLAIATLIFTLWMLQAAVFDFFAGWVSWDYIPSPLVSGRRTLNAGLFLSCLFAACCTMHVQWPEAKWNTIVRTCLSLPVLVGLATIVGGLLSYASYRMGWLNSEAWRLAFPSRYAVFLGMLAGYSAGGWLVALALGARVVNQRWSNRKNPHGIGLS